MIGLVLRLTGLLDRISQAWYRRALRLVLSRLGVRITGLPLWISPTVYLDSPRSGLISIGDRTVISHYVRILTHDFSMDRVIERREGVRDWEYSRRQSVTIERQAFIGMNAILMPGVRIGEGAIVGAGSVVTRDVPPDTVVAGNPARFISSSEDYWMKSASGFARSQRRR